MTTLSAAILLFLVMDPVGNIPLFLAALRRAPPEKHAGIVLREHLIALLVLAFFLLAGRHVLGAFRIEQPALSIAGGIILFLIALKMIFPIGEGLFGASPAGEPFIVPLAMPLIAGPSALTTVLLLMSREPGRWPAWLLALCCSWAASLAILLLADRLSRLVGERALAAFERLMGMLLTVLAVQMFLSGLREFVRAGLSS
jgi:MarC family membrane protein